MVPRRVFTKSEIADIIKRYTKQNESLQSIARHYKSGQDTISKLLTDRQVRIRSRTEVREAFTEEQKKEIIKRFKEGTNAKTLAIEYKTSSLPILKILRRAGIKPRDASDNAQRKLEPREHLKIANSYTEGKSQRELAEEYSVSVPTIKKILIEQECEIRSFTEVRGGLPEEDRLRIAELYQVGMNTVELGRKYGLSSTTISRYLEEMEVEKRTGSEARGGLSPAQKEQVVKRYLDGETSPEIAKDYGIFSSTILRAVQESGNSIRTLSESIILKAERDLDKEDIVRRYLKGESALSIADDYPVTDAGIRSFLRRQGIEIRDAGTWGDSVRHILDGTGNFIRKKETCYYIYTIKGMPGLVKPGIAHDTNRRREVGDGYYDEELLIQVYSSREEAFLIEQAILDATAEYSFRPEELENEGWAGISEIRKIEEDAIMSIFERYHNELEEIGIWHFAAMYVPMTEAEKQIFIERGDEEL